MGFQPCGKFNNITFGDDPHAPIYSMSKKRRISETVSDLLEPLLKKIKSRMVPNINQRINNSNTLVSKTSRLAQCYGTTKQYHSNNCNSQYSQTSTANSFKTKEKTVNVDIFMATQNKPFEEGHIRLNLFIYLKNC